MKKILITTIIGIFLTPGVIFAQAPAAIDQYTLLEPLPCIEGVGGCTPNTMQERISLNDYIMYLYKFSIAIAVFLAIVMIIWGGFLYITSEVPFIKVDGKSKITNAVTGLFFVLVSYLILATIDPRLVNIGAKIPEIPSGIDTTDTEAQRRMAAEIKERERQEADTKTLNERIAAQEMSDEINAERIEMMSRTDESSQRVIEAQIGGELDYTDALTILYDPSSYLGNKSIEQYTGNLATPTSINPYPTDLPGQNVIQNNYNTKIKEIISKNSLEGGGTLYTNDHFEKVQQLKKERDFYITQIQEDVAVQKTIEQSPSSSGAQTIDYIQSKVAAYQKDITDESKISASGLSAERYRNVMQMRIERLNLELSPPTP